LQVAQGLLDNKSERRMHLETLGKKDLKDIVARLRIVPTCITLHNRVSRVARPHLVPSTSTRCSA
jgi:hypothetical protein